MPFITDLPTELLVSHLFPLLSAPDLLHVMLTCKKFHGLFEDDYTWRQLYVHRFETVPATHTSFWGEYKRSSEFRKWFMLQYTKVELARMILSAGKMNITWMNGQYWKMAVEASSPFGHVAKLNSVCWLDVCGVLQRVSPGTYFPVWRLALSDIRALQVLQDVQFEVCVESDGRRDRQISVFTLSNDGSWQEAEYRRIVVTSQSPLVLDSAQDVQFHAYDHSNVWKSGLWVDYVALYRWKPGHGSVEDDCDAYLQRLEHEVGMEAHDIASTAEVSDSSVDDM